ncbi:DUF7738 domain-containing protein [Formosa haliotis]|uniref:DUF7738 domain-containing protein n=1 Tax=Formosa haliotis TaxID=1555194 RepID=UPI0008266F70|nr:hypothetical protein [Formosa haliotis]
MGLFDFRDPSKRKKRNQDITIACLTHAVYINDTEISFPTTYTTLKSIFGEANRIESIKQSKNQVYLWDELGIYCSSPSPDKMLMLLLVQDNRYGLGHQPKKISQEP